MIESKKFQLKLLALECHLRSVKVEEEEINRIIRDQYYFGEAAGLI